MESLLWALNLCAVVYLCLWALRTEKRREKLAQEEVKQRAAATHTESGNA